MHPNLIHLRQLSREPVALVCVRSGRIRNCCGQYSAHLVAAHAFWAMKAPSTACAAFGTGDTLSS